MAQTAKRRLTTSAAIVCVAATAYFVGAADRVAVPDAALAQSAGAVLEEPAAASNLSEAFRRVAREVGPAVVSVSSTRRIGGGGNSPARARPQLPEEFRRFFGDEELERFFEFDIPQRERELRGQGSGIVVREDGYILTNSHVAADADQLEVTLSDGRRFKAELVGADRSTDLAVLKIDADGLTAAKLGDSEKLQVGDWVLAMGSPFGLDHSVTAGIISATSRANMGITDYEDFIQTDAAINPGNSGGPLVNLQGEVVGINTAIASRSGGYMGVGFAIPSNMARHVMNSIITEGHVTRGYLGAMIQDLNEDLAQSFGYDANRGVLIGDVVDGGPADKAGLRSGDIVTKFNGEPVESASEFRNAVAGTAPQTTVSLEIFRDGNRKQLKVTVGKLTPDKMPSARRAAEAESTGRLGLAIRDLTPELAQRLGVDEDAEGVVVTRVEPGSPAARLGIEPGDMIVSANGEAIDDEQDFYRLLDAEKLKKGVRIQIMRDGVRRFAFLQVE